MPRTINSITAANSVLVLSVRDLIAAPVRIQGYGSDAMIEVDAAESVETMKGIDGVMSAGWVPFMLRTTITLNADSPSRQFFEQWFTAQTNAREILWADGSLRYPSIRMEYTMNKGALRGAPIFPSARRVLQATAYVIEWDEITPNPIA